MSAGGSCGCGKSDSIGGGVGGGEMICGSRGGDERSRGCEK